MSLTWCLSSVCRMSRITLNLGFSKLGLAFLGPFKNCFMALKVLEKALNFVLKNVYMNPGLKFLYNSRILSDLV